MVFGCATADVEEVCGFAAGELDDVHGCHGEAGTVHEAGDVSVEADVVEVILAGLHFARVFFGLVAHGHNVWLAEEGVVVEVELRVEGEESLVGRHHERVDFDEGAIGLDEEAVEVGEQFRGLVHQGAAQAEGGCDASGLVGLEADGGVDADSEDFFRGLFGNGFDVHSAFGAGDDDRSRCGAVEEDGKVEFALDVNGFGDEDFADEFSFRTGLMGDEGLADHFAGGCGCFVGVVTEVNAAFEAIFECALSAATGMDLGFHHDVCNA